MTTVRPPAGEWTPSLPPVLADQALSVALDVAARVRGAERHDRPDSPLWGGGAGIALLYGQLDRYRPGQGWDGTAHDFLRWGVRTAERFGGMSPGPLGGMGGLAFAARLLSKGGTRYGSLLSTVDAEIRRTVAAIGPVEHGVRVACFDVIAGAAGVVAYLLDTGAETELRRLLAMMVALCGERDGVPHWQTPHDLIANPLGARFYPGGQLNCGLAHGSPGMLAAMALAVSAGHEVEGQREAVYGLVKWLLENQIDDRWGANWPTAVALPVGSRHPMAARTGWCYGAPGVARALWLAGVALDEHDLRAIAVDAMAAACERSLLDGEVTGSSLCHGFAGLLQLALRFEHDSGDLRFAGAVVMLTEQLLAAYQPTALFGYHSVEADGSVGDNPGLLEGASGVALALLAASLPVTPTWDRALVLS